MFFTDSLSMHGDVLPLTNWLRYQIVFTASLPGLGGPLYKLICAAGFLCFDSLVIHNQLPQTYTQDKCQMLLADAAAGSSAPVSITCYHHSDSFDDDSVRSYGNQVAGLMPTNQS
jgi:hypothetical protein